MQLIGSLFNHALHVAGRNLRYNPNIMQKVNWTLDFTWATIRNINNKEQVMIFCSGLYCPQLYWSNMHPSFRCVNAHVTYHFYIVQVSHSCPTSHHYPTHTTPLSHFPHPVLPLHIWTVVSGAFRGVPCLSIVLFTSPRRPAWHAPYICVKKIPSPPNVIPCFALFLKRKRSETRSSWPPNAQGTDLTREEFSVLDQAYSLMYPIWTGNKVILFTVHKVPTWICYSWFW